MEQSRAEQSRVWRWKYGSGCRIAVGTRRQAHTGRTVSPSPDPSAVTDITPIPVFPESLRDRTWARYFILDLIAIFTDRKMEPFDLLQSFLSRA